MARWEITNHFGANDQLTEASSFVVKKQLAAPAKRALTAAVQSWIEPLETRIHLSLTHHPEALHVTIAHAIHQPLAVDHAQPAHHHHDRDLHEHEDHEHEGDGDGDGDGEEEEEEKIPAPALNQEPDSTGGIFNNAPIDVTTGSWTFLGPAPSGTGTTANSGRITGIAAHPTDANTIYIATAGGGVWKTINGGTTWSPLTDTQSTLFMGSIAIAPSNPNIIYAGTGEANNSVDSYYGRGVLKSIDAGVTWTLMGNSVFDRRAISKIVIDPANANTLYVTVGGFPSNGFSGNRGVWRSTDGGTNWTNTTTGISTSSSFTDLVMDPSNSQVLYCAVGTYSGSTANGIYKTTNGGGSWAAAGNFGNGSANGRIALAIAPSNGQVLYAAVTSPSTYGLLRMMTSVDGGTTWTQLVNTPNNQGGQGWYDTTLIVDPTNSSIVYAGGAASSNHVMKTSDAGVSWSSISTGTGGGPHVDHHAIAFDAAGKLLDGNDGGIWKLTNASVGSIAWSDINGNLGTLQFQGIAISNVDPNIAFGGTQDNGTMQFSGGLVWTPREGGDGGDVAIYDVSASDAIAAVAYHIAPVASFGSAAFFRRSDNAGVSWASKTTGISASDPSNFYPPFVLDPGNSGNRLLLGTNRVYETTNRGDSWTPISTTNTAGWTTAGNVKTIALAPSDINTIYASVGGLIFATTNRGVSWTARNITGATDSIVNMLVDPNSALTAYAVRDVFGGNKVFRTIDGGANWASITGNLPDYPVNDIVMDTNGAGTADDVLYVGNDIGIYTSSDLGTTWTRLGNNFPNAIVLDLEFAPGLEILAAGTHGRGVWNISTAPAVNTGSIAGQTFQDNNGNGIFDGGEPTISGVTVYLDIDSTGTLTGPDQIAISNGTGNYIFSALADGTYSVGEVTPTNYIRTGTAFQSAVVSAGGAVTGKNIGNFPTVFNGSTGIDNYTVRIDPTNALNFQVLEQLNGGSTTTYTVTKSLLSTITINSDVADDVITVDYANGNPLPSAGLRIDAGASTTGDRVSVLGAGAADTLDLENLDTTTGAGIISIKNVELATVTGNAGNDALTLGIGLTGNVFFDGGTNTDSLTFNGTDAVNNIALTVGTITMGAVSDTYANLESLIVNARLSSDTLTVNHNATSPATTLDLSDGDDGVTVTAANTAGITVQGGNGNDSVNLGAGALAAVSVSGGIGTDSVTVTGTTGADTVAVDTLSVTRTGAGFSTALDTVEALTVDTGLGTDVITVNSTASTMPVTVLASDANDSLVMAAAATTTVTFDGGIGSNDIAFNGTTGNDTNINITNAAITMTGKTLNYSNTQAIVVNALAGNDTITLNSTSAAAAVTVNGGDANDTMTIAGAPSSAVLFNGGLLGTDADTLNINAGTYTFAADANVGSANLSVSVGAAGTALFNATQHIASLTVSGQATLSSGGAKVIVTKSLSVPGKLNLTDNDLIVDFVSSSPLGTWSPSSYSGITGMIASGFNGGLWNGVGINTTLGSNTLGIGVGETSDVLSLTAGQTAMWSNQTVDSTAVLLKYTYLGDMNLDGSLNADDYARIDLYFTFPGSNLYSHGDLNYNGAINADDYAVIDLNASSPGPTL
jgi:hypothetical protein